MGWRGIAIGGCIGSLFGGPVGAAFGAVFGHRLEERRAGARRRGSGRAGPRRRAPDPLGDAYAALGAGPADSTAELARRYRELAKKFHPDVARARGLSADGVAAATERMSRINAAWARIRAARGC